MENLTISRPFGFYINGEWVQPHGDRTYTVHNPAKGEALADVPCANAQDVDAAVHAAHESFKDGAGPWSSISGAERAVVLRKMATVVTANKVHLAKFESLNTGKPYRETIWDMDDVAGCFDYFAEQAERIDSLQNTTVPLPMTEFHGKLQYFPTGVVAAIIPWNYPLLMAAWKLAPALASGCSVIIKPSELTPITLLELFHLWHNEAVGLPHGVLNLLTGDGQTGALLTSHLGVDKVAFTGSVPTGARIMESCSPRVANITLELGGKSPLIIFDDVNVDHAVEWALFGCFWTNGQICSATSRVLVHANIYDQFISRIIEATSKIPIVDPQDENFTNESGVIGPIVSSGQYTRVTHFVQTARDEDGARILYGGERPSDKPEGYFLQPTLIEVTNTDVTVWNEEIFGPVMSIAKFDSEEQALEMANKNKYGLAGGVISQDLERCERVAKGLRCGIVWKNCSQPCFVHMPWGGIKLSGIGRELGSEGIFNYLQTKSVVEYVSSNPWGWYIK